MSHSEQISRILEHAVRTLVDAVMKETHQTLMEQSTYYTQRNAPVPRATFVRAAKAGEFPSYRVHRLYVAKKSDVHKWLESSAVKQRKPLAQQVLTVDELADMIGGKR